MRKSAASLQSFSIGDLELLPPVVEPGAIFCAENAPALNSTVLTGQNDHGFSISHRLPRNLVAPNQALMIPTTASTLDWAGGLSAVIGKRGRYIEASHARAHIFGYCIYSEGILSSNQKRGAGNGLGDDYEATTALGPFLVTTDEVQDPYLETLVMRINGDERMREPLSHVVVRFESLIEQLSAAMELQPGDIVCTRIPTHTQVDQKEKSILKDGELISVEVSRIGTLIQSIKAENTDRNAVACSC